VNRRSVLLAAGGTGGHLFPAFALAQELARRSIVVDLVTDMRGESYGGDFPARAVYRVPAATLTQRRLVAALATATLLARGVLAAYRLLGTVRPGAALGFGGYPSFPPLLAASLRRIPTALHEQNAVLGRANRMLARRVRVIATSFEPTRGVAGGVLAKARVTGNPVRDHVRELAGRRYAAPVSEGPFSLLVFGGSQGARVFSDTLPPALALLPRAVRERVFLVQQCRAEDLARVEAAYQTAGIRAHLATFFANLPEEMAKAHLVVARAGASTVAELTVLGRPAILVPLPHAVDNDQLENATRIAEAGGGWLLEQRQLSPERLAAAIAGLVERPATLEAAAQAAKQLGRPDAVQRLADLVEELIGSDGKSA
jgi:UDP-N-acetylglucosamine--N-acetylmuramyl-(pentapeptide) pyrophosphoryl-undecaprenol N-acetylglucosamine transferase